jgi:DNA-binding CsgD family transcriptional regulator
VAIGGRTDGEGAGRGRLTGRAAETALLAGALDRAREGRPSLVVVEGEAGIGKSALVRDLVAGRGPDVRVLLASGEEAEQRLDLGIAEQLLREAEVLGLAAPPLGRGGARPDPLRVGAALLDLIRAATATAPLLVVVDDAQWADQPSLHALTFALRRLRREPVLTVVAQRPDALRLEPLHRLAADGDGRRIRLAGLDAHDLRSLVADRAGVSLAPRAGDRLHAHTRGSPLEALALVDELDPDELASGLGPLPAPRSYATVMLNRVAAAPADVERLVTAVAVVGMPVRVGLLAAMLGTDDIGALDAAIDHATRRGLLEREVRGGTTVLDVCHPLLRSAILGDLAPGARAQLHRRATLITRDPTRQMLHRLAAVLGEDPALGREAVELARDRLRHGWELSAVDLLVLAIERFPDGPERDEAVLLTVDSLLAIGDLATARDLLAGVEPRDDRAREHLLRGQLAFLDGDRRAAVRALRQAWDRDPEPDVAARAALVLATIASNGADGDRALEWARKALDRGGPDGPDAGHALTMVASAWALAGDLAAGAAEVADRRARLGRTAPSGDPGTAGEPTGAGTDRAGHPPGRADDTLLPHGLLLLWRGALHEALAAFDAGQRADGGGQLLVTATVHYSAADARYRIGDWDGALTEAEQLATTLDDTGVHLASPMAHSVAAFVLAGRGLATDAERHLALGAEAMAAADNPSGLLWLEVAAARLADACGDHAEVVRHLQPLADLTAHLRLPEGVQPWRADLVEAHTALGDLDPATAELEALDLRLDGGGPHALAGAARARGLLAAARGDHEAASAAFAPALATDPEQTGTFARARLELAAGGVARRRGHRREAADLLEAALSRLTALGASPYVERARRELAACGLTPRSRDGADADALTPAESAVARLVAHGSTNREVAAELVVSVKTVESHLSKVFAKLGVRSRTELANRWADGALADPPLT